MAFNIADLIEHSVDLVPERTAVVCGDRRVTYGELEERANRLAHHFAAQGIGKDDHVGIYAYNSVEFVETMLAAFKLRAVPININYRYVEDELQYIFDNADLVALVHQHQFAPKVAAVAPRTPLLRHLLVIPDETGSGSYEDALAANSPERAFEARTADDLYILYTGGTTGMPKGVVWRHEDVWRVLGGGINFETGVPVEDEWEQARTGKENGPVVTLPIAPLMHGAAQWATLGGLFQANTIVLMPRFDPHEVWRTVEREKVNLVQITGDAMGRPMVEALREGPADAEKAGGYDTSSLFAISSSAAVFSPTVKDEYLELLPDVVITDAVGSTESGFNGVTMVQSGAEQKGGGPTVKMGPDTIVIDDDGHPVGPGVVGRMARGGNVPLGYHKDEARSAQTFITVDGKRYSVPGDYAVVEEDGTMTLLGRGTVCINSGGEKIFPEEVEAALKSHPAVFDAIVVGVPDERWGQTVAAVVQPRPGMTPTLDELDAHCRTKIAGYKVPRELHLVDDIQRQPSGKPNYPWAQEYALKARSG